MNQIKFAMYFRNFDNYNLRIIENILNYNGLKLTTKLYPKPDNGFILNVTTIDNYGKDTHEELLAISDAIKKNERFMYIHDGDKNGITVSLYKSHSERKATQQVKHSNEVIEVTDMASIESVSMESLTITDEEKPIVLKDAIKITNPWKKV